MYRSPAAALYRLYAALCGRVISSLVSQVHHSLFKREIFHLLDLRSCMGGHTQQPPTKLLKTTNIQQLYQDIMEQQGGDPNDFLTRVDLFSINLLADVWFMLCEESMAFTFHPETAPPELETRQMVAKLFSVKLRHEMFLRTCIALVETLLQPENDAALHARIHSSLTKLRTAYISAALAILSHEARVNPLVEEETSRRLEHAQHIALHIGAVLGNRLQYLSARSACLVSDHRMGALIAKVDVICTK